MAPANSPVADYYTQFGKLFDILLGKEGFYNLGWLPPEGGSFRDAQRLLVERTLAPLRNVGGAALEIGSGLGGPARLAREILGRKVFGLELLKRQLDAAQFAGGATFVQGDACRLPFRDSSIGGIYCVESAFHYTDKTAFIHEVARVLAPGGVFSLAEVMLKPRRKGWLADKFAYAFGAPEFFTRTEYEIAALERGLMLAECEDLTPGVARSMRKAADLALAQWKQLRRSYSILEPAAFIFAGRLFGRFYPLEPIEYRRMEFRK